MTARPRAARLSRLAFAIGERIGAHTYYDARARCLSGSVLENELRAPSTRPNLAQSAAAGMEHCMDTAGAPSKPDFSQLSVAVTP